MGSPPAAYSWSTYFCSASWEHLGKLLSARQTACSGCSFSLSLSDASWQALSVRQAACVDAIINVFKASRQPPSVRLPVGVWCFSTLIKARFPTSSRRWLAPFHSLLLHAGLVYRLSTQLLIASQLPTLSVSWLSRLAAFFGSSRCCPSLGSVGYHRLAALPFFIFRCCCVFVGVLLLSLVVVLRLPSSRLSLQASHPIED